MPDRFEGRTVAHFRILARLGEGGMGVVHRAQDERLQRTVALKLLRSEVAGGETRRERFLREARAAAAVSHPGIAAIHEIGEAEGMSFITMELVEGKTLREHQSVGPLAVEEVVGYATQIADALDRAHTAGVVHRDLKPAGHPHARRRRQQERQPAHQHRPAARRNPRPGGRADALADGRLDRDQRRGDLWDSPVDGLRRRTGARPGRRS